MHRFFACSRANRRRPSSRTRVWPRPARSRRSPPCSTTGIYSCSCSPPPCASPPPAGRSHDTTCGSCASPTGSNPLCAARTPGPRCHTGPSWRSSCSSPGIPPGRWAPSGTRCPARPRWRPGWQRCCRLASAFCRCSAFAPGCAWSSGSSRFLWSRTAASSRFWRCSSETCRGICRCASSLLSRPVGNLIVNGPAPAENSGVEFERKNPLTSRPAALLCRLTAALGSWPVSCESTYCLEIFSPKSTSALHPPHNQPGPPGPKTSQIFRFDVSNGTRSYNHPKKNLDLNPTTYQFSRFWRRRSRNCQCLPDCNSSPECTWPPQHWLRVQKMSLWWLEMEITSTLIEPRGYSWYSRVSKRV